MHDRMTPEFYELRSAAEAKLAVSATTEDAREIHQYMAEAYGRLAEELKPRKRLSPAFAL